VKVFWSEHEKKKLWFYDLFNFNFNCDFMENIIKNNLTK
jgi:hypothetical protein